MSRKKEKKIGRQQNRLNIWLKIKRKKAIKFEIIEKNEENLCNRNERLKRVKSVVGREREREREREEKAC